MKVRLPRNRTPTHPGEILLLDFLEPLGVTQAALARHLEIPTQRVNEIVKGKRGVSAETAWLFSAAFGTTPEFWLNLQLHHDLAAVQKRRRPRRLRARTGS
ncbi:MAG: HigA family addiction module antitoxin [Planctomycetota bacterium]|jgi:addiction module HigA family antidote